jgi:hypothetical protein
MLGQDGLGVELHASIGAVAASSVWHAHDLAVVGPGGDLQLGRQAGPLDHQRVVADHGELLRQLGKTPRRSVVMTLVLPCIWVARTMRRAHGRPDALVAQAHAQDGQLAGEVPDGRHEMPASAGEQGPGESTRRSGQAGDAFQGDLVVADHLHLLAQLRSTGPG